MSSFMAIFCSFPATTSNFLNLACSDLEQIRSTHVKLALIAQQLASFALYECLPPIRPSHRIRTCDPTRSVARSIKHSQTL